MSSIWNPRVLGQPPSSPLLLGWEEAQPWCNFVLMRPRHLPEGSEEDCLSVRPEAEPGPDPAASAHRPAWTRSHRASHLCVLKGKGKKLRIKQFLFDFAPPAFDHPCLWKSPEIRPFSVGRQLAWVGTDFTGHLAASLHRDRTMIELRVLEGRYRDVDLVKVLRGMSAVDPAARESILQTPFTHLSYQNRHQEKAVEVPVGYWRHRRHPELEVRAFTAEEAQDRFGRLHMDLPARLGYHLDSAFAFYLEGTVCEVEWIYEEANRGGHYLRLLTSPHGADHAVPFPPPPEAEQACHREVLPGRGAEIHYARLTPEYGAHEAVWQAGDLNVMLLIKPAPWTSQRWFKEWLENLLEASPP